MGKAAGCVAGALLVVVVLFFVGIPAIAAAADTGTADGLCGPGGTAQTVTDQHLDAEQMANAATIVSVVQQRGIPARAAVISLATAYQETKFVNYTVHTDNTTSLGLFAQMTIYFGADVAVDPAKATGAFLDILIRQPNWQTRPLTDVAADVQKPYEPYRGLYAPMGTPSHPADHPAVDRHRRTRRPPVHPQPQRQQAFPCQPGSPRQGQWPRVCRARVPVATAAAPQGPPPPRDRTG